MTDNLDLDARIYDLFAAYEHDEIIEKLENHLQLSTIIQDWPNVSECEDALRCGLCELNSPKRLEFLRWLISHTTLNPELEAMQREQFFKQTVMTCAYGSSEETLKSDSQRISDITRQMCGR